MKAIKQYAKFLAKKKAYEAILDDLKGNVLRELKHLGGKTNVAGVEFHTTVKVTRKYNKDIRDILKDLKEQMENQKKLAEESGKVRLTATPTFDAQIPKSAAKDVLSTVPDYVRHFVN
jgi:hypothetical protein